MSFTDISSFVMVLNYTYCLCISNIAQTNTGNILYKKDKKLLPRPHRCFTYQVHLSKLRKSFKHNCAYILHTHIIVNCIETTIKLQKKILFGILQISSHFRLLQERQPFLRIHKTMFKIYFLSLLVHCHYKICIFYFLDS